MPRERQAILASLPTKGFEWRDGRNHDVLRLYYKGRKTGLFTIVSRGKEYKDYNDPLLAKMSRHLRITRAQLNLLIDCDMDGPSYIEALRANGVNPDTI
ncbi:MAG: hypothetical protein ACREA0_06190 [bacterium]